MFLTVGVVDDVVIYLLFPRLPISFLFINEFDYSDDNKEFEKKEDEDKDDYILFFFESIKVPIPINPGVLTDN